MEPSVVRFAVLAVDLHLTKVFWRHAIADQELSVQNTWWQRLTALRRLQDAHQAAK